MYDIIQRAESMMYQQQPDNSDKSGHGSTFEPPESTVCVCVCIMYNVN